MKNVDVIQAKLFYHRDEISSLVKKWKLQQKRIIFTNGCFDIMHAGHIDYLSKAADLGDILVVGLNSDSSVQQLKGDNRPINNQNSRMRVLASLFFINAVVIFDEATPYKLIEAIKPNILVKGGDYTDKEVVGFDLVQASGGEIVILDLVPGYSTSLIEQKIIEKFQR